MATCIENSINHAVYSPASSPCCKSNNSICRVIRHRRASINTSNPDSPNSINQYVSCTKPMASRKVSSQDQCGDDDKLWVKIRQEAESNIMQEPILSKYYHSTILSHVSLETALANHLAIKLGNANLSRESLYDIFLKALVEDSEIGRAIRDDLKAVRERDPACISYVHCFLNFKGFLACQAHRLAHIFWTQGRSVLAFLIQNQVSEVFAMDIHPGAKIGRGIVFDHGTGIVIGETAVIGNNVTILHGVTLGGTGKIQRDRHPKIGDGVLIGAGAKVLGNVRIGEDAKIGAGSVVLKEVPPKATAVGNPARLVKLG